MKKYAENNPSWYLDPLVAAQKRQVHQQWIRDATGSRSRTVVLKTDLFEEAYGADRILNDLFPGSRLTVGVDLQHETVVAATRRSNHEFITIVCDVRHLPLPTASVDIVVSNSTLDHFDSQQDLLDSLQELTRVLRPDGVLLVTLDNPWNPLYHVLRWASHRGRAPYSLGETLSLSALTRILKERGFRIESASYLIHNPRVISTILFLWLRRMLGRNADRPIRVLLAGFALLDKLPMRPLTGCFAAVSAIKGNEE